MMITMGVNESAVMLFNQRAGDYQQKYMDVSLYASSLDMFCGLLTQPRPRILELACGPGNITKYLLNKRPDFQVVGTDLAPNMIALAKQNNPGAVFKLMDGRDIGQLNQTYNALVCGFYLPYLSGAEIKQLLANAYKLLLPGGILYLSTMEGEKDELREETSSKGERLLTYYHSADTLLKFLRENKFRLIKLIRQPSPPQLGQATKDIILLACI